MGEHQRLVDATLVCATATSTLLWLAHSNGIDTHRVDDVLAVVGLTDVAGDRVGTFSLGMSQRLGIAAALLGDPETLIFDEPINGLDPDGILWIRTLMRSLASEGRTVFLSSHLMSEMAQTAEHLIVIGRGRIIADGAIDEIIRGNAVSSVRVVARAHAKLARLLVAEGGKVERLADGALDVTSLDSAAIGRVAASNDVALVALTPRGASLEEAFLELTHNDTDYRVGALVGTGPRAGSPT